MVYGTDNGVYLANLLAKEKSPIKVVAVANVTQVDVLEEYGILIVLAGMTTFWFPSKAAILKLSHFQTRPSRPSL